MRAALVGPPTNVLAPTIGVRVQRRRLDQPQVHAISDHRLPSAP
ncbi:hypothetical protein ACQP04_21785 [Pseudonocardia halophobica]